MDHFQPIQSQSLLHCCSQCHVSEGCRGVAYAEGECWLIAGTAAARCRLFEGDCDSCQYKFVLMDLYQEDDNIGL
jgi:hypothetical protein